jgi:hypothetical protein
VTNASLQRLRFSLSSLLLFVSALCAASATPSHSEQFRKTEIPVAIFHHAQTDRAIVAKCESTRPPEALATPDPLLDPQDPADKVAVSFVIGIDGRIHSPVILESAGSYEDLRVLQTLREWRYRPATCNAAPTEMESKVEFFSR